jgi:cytochrome P450
MEDRMDMAMLDQVLPDTRALAGLRSQGPVHRVRLPTGAPAWLVVGYDEVAAALGDPRLSVAAMMQAGALDGGTLRPEQRYALLNGLTNLDPPDHTRVRKLISKAFTPRRVETMRPWIGELADSLVAGFEQRDRVELMSEFASPLPMTVICELLGVPNEDRQRFGGWSRAIMSGFGTPQFPVDDAEQFIAYVRDLIAIKREAPDDALLSAMIQARDEGDRLSEDELSSMAFLMILAGHETTVSLLGNGMYLLLSEPERAQRLREDPGLLPGAVDEFLRLESPVPAANMRAALSSLDLGGVHVEAGELVLVGLQSANRDDTRFESADRLDFTRAQGRHLAFGHGVHYCLGAPLARLEGVVAIGTLLRRLPNLRLAVPAAELNWSKSLFVHRLDALPLEFG